MPVTEYTSIKGARFGLGKKGTLVVDGVELSANAAGAAAAIVALTDNSGGTADNTIAAVPNATAASTDTSAASLASVNTTITALKNNIADLTAKVNALVAAAKL